MTLWHVGWRTEEGEDVKPYFFSSWLAAKLFLLSEIDFVIADGAEHLDDARADLEALQDPGEWSHDTGEWTYYIEERTV